MPIYEYQCQSCSKELEVLQKMSDEPLQECPACGESALKKKISAAAFRLKGGGWYETDFKTGNKKNLAGGSDAGSDAGSEKGDKGDKSAPSSSDSKPSDAGPAKSKTSTSNESA